MNKFIAAFLLNCMLFSSVFAVGDLENLPTLTDIEGHWAVEYIVALAGIEVVNGYEDDTFRPDQSVTRAEFVKLLIASMDYWGVPVPMIDPTGFNFDDVAESDWHYTYVLTAAVLDFVGGYGDEFRPNQTITRAEAASILAKVSEFDADAERPDNPYSDVTEAWQIPYIIHVGQLDFMRGYRDDQGNYNDQFGPNDPLTRAEASKVIAILIDYKTDTIPL